MIPPPAHIEREGGLTLVELVVVIALTGIISIPAGMLMAEQIRLALRARDASIAMSLARMELEVLESRTMITGLPGNQSNACHADFSNGTFVSYAGQPYTLIRTVVCQIGNCVNNCGTTNNGNNGIKRVEITVARNGTTEVVARLTAYRTKFLLDGP